MEDAHKYSAQPPDVWIKRASDLIPLTGPHPFNAEPPATLLLEKGFITPNEIHYVRNHGAVPKLDWTEHKLTIDGLVAKARTWTMDQLASLPSISVAVTLSCDGNRRKEVNTIQRGRGFDWGPGAVATAVWTGVPLYQLLRMCGDMSPKARYVHFEGADKLPRGRYGTSIPLYRATDPTNEIIVAYRMNNEPLPPDHGFPLRVVLPGFVGARSVKWLTKITVSEHESESPYHYYDNKVLPPWVSPEVADTDPIWKKPQFTLYDLNVNSVIVYPEHEQWIDEPLPKNSSNRKVTFKGFAYCGGGRRITRVELTTDNGKTWMPAQISYPDSNSERADKKCWTWCHWQAEMQAWKLLSVQEVAVRAFDDGCNTQPEHITWNVLGMMNNAWYRVKIDVQDVSGAPRIAFHHPVLPGLLQGGWRVRPQDNVHRVEWASKMPLALPSGSVAAARTQRQFSRAEVAKHNKLEDCWIIVEQEVIDITPYIKSHPGGPDALHLFAGRDVTELFLSLHAHDAHAIKDMYTIGTIVGADETEMIPQSKSLPERALDPRYWLLARLIRRTDEASDVRRFVFQLERDGKDAKCVGLPPGLHVLIGLEINGELVVRPYTPTRPVVKDEDDGTMEFIIRIYPKGQLTPHLDHLKVGERVAVKGPMGGIVYMGRGVFTVHNCSRFAEKVSMVAGGTGITPLYQVLRHALHDKEDKTQFYLIYAARSEDQLLLRKELEDLAKMAPDRLKIWFAVEAPPKDGTWPYDVGRVTEEMMRKHLAFPPTKEVLSLFCGPPVMIDDVVIPYVVKIGYVEQQAEEF